MKIHKLLYHKNMSFTPRAITVAISLCRVPLSWAQALFVYNVTIKLETKESMSVARMARMARGVLAGWWQRVRVGAGGGSAAVRTQPGPGREQQSARVSRGSRLARPRRDIMPHGKH